MTTAVATMNDRQEMQEILQENLGGSVLTAQDLTKIKVPNGSTTWEIPTGEGEETEPTRAIDAVIIAQINHRIYFAERDANDTETKPPECSSPDAITGYGNPGGVCKTCAFAQFGSKGKGQACSARVNLYIMRDEDYLPVVIDLSPSSNVNLRRYMTQLTTMVRKPFYAVKTRLTLKKMEAPGGRTYSVVEFKMVEKLDNDQAQSMSEMKDMFIEMLHASTQQKANNNPKIQESFIEEEAPTYQTPQKTASHVVDANQDDEPTF